MSASSPSSQATKWYSFMAGDEIVLASLGAPCRRSMIPYLLKSKIRCFAVSHYHSSHHSLHLTFLDRYVHFSIIMKEHFFSLSPSPSLFWLDTWKPEGRGGRRGTFTSEKFVTCTSRKVRKGGCQEGRKEGNYFLKGKQTALDPSNNNLSKTRLKDLSSS